VVSISQTNHHHTTTGSNASPASRMIPKRQIRHAQRRLHPSINPCTSAGSQPQPLQRRIMIPSNLTAMTRDSHLLIASNDRVKRPHYFLSHLPFFPSSTSSHPSLSLLSCRAISVSNPIAYAPLIAHTPPISIHFSAPLLLPLPSLPRP
jgi:hypothetical protein